MKQKLIYYTPSILICLFLGFIPSNSFAQTGTLQGKVADIDSGEGIPFANVSVSINGVLVGVQTDFDGLYQLFPMPIGQYEIKVSFVGYREKIIQNVLVEADKIHFLDIALKEPELSHCVFYEPIPFRHDQTSTGLSVRFRNGRPHSINSVDFYTK